MNDLNLIEDMPEEDVGFRFEDQDLRIFKVLTSEPRLATEFTNTQTPEVFLGDAREVGVALCEFVKTYKSVPTKRILLDQYKNNDVLCKKFEQVFESINSLDFNPNEYKYDLEKLKQRYVDVRVADLKDGLLYGKGDVPSTVKGMEQALKDINRVSAAKAKQTYIQKSLKEHIPEFKAEYVARIKNPALTQGILSGYSYLDYITNGIRPAELFIVGSESGTGKSTWLNNMAIQMWMQKNTIDNFAGSFVPGFNILYFSLEMPFDGCFRRSMARIADVPAYGLRDSTLTKQEAGLVSMSSKFIHNYPYQFEIIDVPRGVTVERIEEIYLETRERFEPHVVVVDYLGLLSDPEAEGDDWLKLGHISGKLHEFARVYGTRVLTATQLNRVQPKKDQDRFELIGLHRFGRSSLIAHHANICMQIETRQDEDMRGDLVYHIIKNRDGERGHHSVTKKFSHSAIYDSPYQPPDRDEMGALITGFNEEEDISEQLAKILGI